MKDILLEIDSIKQRSQKSVNELHGLYDFFKIFTKTFQEEVDNFDLRLYEHQQIYKNITGKAEENRFEYENAKKLYEDANNSNVLLNEIEKINKAKHFSDEIKEELISEVESSKRVR